MPEMNPAPLFSTRPWLIPVANANGVPLDADRDRDAWVTARRSGLGGSDVAAIVGESTDKSAIDVFLDARGEGMPMLDTDFTFMGRELEPVVTSLYARGGEAWPRPGGDLVLYKPPTVYHRDRPWQRGSADGLAWPTEVAGMVVSGVRGPGVLSTELLTATETRMLLAIDPDHGLEVKTHGWFAARAQYDRNDDGVPVAVPAGKRIQCAWYMALYQVDRWVLAALVDTSRRKTYEIQRDRQVEDYLLEEADLFWRKHVLTGEPPPPDGSKSFKTYLAKKFADHDHVIVSSTPEIDLAAATLREVREEEKILERRKELLEQQIKSFIGSHAGVSTTHGVLTYKSRPSGKYRDKDMRSVLYARAGMTDHEIAEFEENYAQPPHRAMNLPAKWRTK